MCVGSRKQTEEAAVAAMAKGMFVEMKMKAKERRDNETGSCMHESKSALRCVHQIEQGSQASEKNPPDNILFYFALFVSLQAAPPITLHSIAITSPSSLFSSGPHSFPSINRSTISNARAGWSIGAKCPAPAITHSVSRPYRCTHPAGARVVVAAAGVVVSLFTPLPGDGTSAHHCSREALRYPFWPDHLR